MSRSSESKRHDGQRWINEAGDVLGKIQPSERCYELAFVFRIPPWPLRRDDHSGVLIGAGGTRCSYWPIDCTRAGTRGI